MQEVGIDISERHPKGITPEDVEWAEVVVTMGCGEDACPVLPGKRYLDWNLPYLIGEAGRRGSRARGRHRSPNRQARVAHVRRPWARGQSWLTRARETSFPPGAFGPLPPVSRVAVKPSRVCVQGCAGCVTTRGGGAPGSRWAAIDRPRGGDRVELVRVVEHGGLGRPRAARVVMHGHGVEQLGPHLDLQRRRALLDQPQAEMDVAEQPALVRRAERRPALELERPADVM